MRKTRKQLNLWSVMKIFFICFVIQQMSLIQDPIFLFSFIPVLKILPAAHYMHYLRLPFADYHRIVIRKDPSVINNTYITPEKTKEVGGIPPMFQIKSIVHLTKFENAYFFQEFSLSDIAMCTQQCDSSIRPEKEVIGEIENAAAYFMGYIMWGHNIHDLLCSLFYLPEELLHKNLTIMGAFHYPERVDSLVKLLGLNLTLLPRVFNHSQMYFVRNLYVLGIGGSSHGYIIGSLPKLRKLVEKRFNLTQNRAKVYALINRPKGSSKMILNEDELLKALNERVKLEDSTWVKLVDPMNDWLTTAKVWNSMRVYVAPCGSMCYNNIFMEPKTGMVLQYTNQLDQPNIQLAIACDMYMIGVVHPKIHHTQFNADVPCDIDRMTRAARLVVDVVNTGKWGDRSWLIPGFDINEINRADENAV